MLVGSMMFLLFAQAATATAAAPAQAESRPPVAGASAAVNELFLLIDKRIDAAKVSPAEVEKVDAEIRTKYEKPLAVMITDLTGMTRLTQTSGILGMLGLIRQVQRVADPIIRADGSIWVKIDADDLFVVAPTTRGLYKNARDLLAAIKKFAADEKLPIGMAIGLSYGPVLMIGADDTWGDAVNVASKLGEDAAEPGEILMSREFHTQLLAEGENPACRLVPPADRKAAFPYYSCHGL